MMRAMFDTIREYLPFVAALYVRHMRGASRRALLLSRYTLILITRAHAPRDGALLMLRAMLRYARHIDCY